jgi:aspartokinase/homoserine dehydrogenase 1
MDATAIIAGRYQADKRLSVVVSAVAGITNSLLDSITGCIAGNAPEEYVGPVKKIHQDICGELGKRIPEFEYVLVNEKLMPLFEEYARLLEAVRAFGECPQSVHCRIAGMGELFCVTIMEAALAAEGLPVTLLDSRRFIFTTGKRDEGDPDYERIRGALAPYRNDAKPAVLLFPGFVCSFEVDAAKTEPGLLGRNGSDFSAAIIGSALDADKVEFWTDVDGIYTADPRIVKDAILVDTMTYAEAMELSFFGSKVLHPKTLAPLASGNIEAWSLNSMNTASKGTRIGASGGADSAVLPVQGISCLKHTAMISVSGAGMRGRRGTAARIFSAVSRAGISVLLITQSSSEYTLSFCIRQSQAGEAVKALESEFELEIREGLVNAVEVKPDCAIVSIVGDGMRQRRGTAGTFFNALASNDVNILAIAQGSSERSLSAVIDGAMSDTAVRISHRFFFNTAQTIEVFAFGTGAIGGCLLDQIRDQMPELASQKIDIRVSAIADVNKMILDDSGNGLVLADWRPNLAASENASSLDAILEYVGRTKPLNPVFVDCTASYDLPERYLDILGAGMHIATPNKRANSMSIGFYHALRQTANKMRRRFLYETNVGAGLPIIDTLQNLFKSGDRLTSFSGIMSGSLSYIFGRLDEGALFSQAVLEAKEKRYTEPDPRDDLSGLDVARKALIIARESGLDVELDDIKLHKVFPPDFDDSGSIDEFLAKLPQADPWFAERMETLRKDGKTLRMGASIEDGKCSVGILEVDNSNPLYGVKGGENAFVFTTNRYRPIPLVVRGYGAGAAVTAAGVFGDILRTVSWNPGI